MLDQHFKAYWNNTLELYKWFNTEWSRGMYFADFQMKCRQQVLHCLNHFAYVCKDAANNRKDKRANTVECEQQTNTHSVSQEEGFLE